MNKLILVLLSFLIFAGCNDSTRSTGSTGPQGSSEVESTKAGLQRALAAMTTRQWSGGWADNTSLDGLFVQGQASGTMPYHWLTVQPPATPATARTFLRAARIFDDDIYLHHARMAMRALLAVQTEEGGFPKESPPATGAATGATFDDDVTTGAFDFFVDLWQSTGEEEARQAMLSVGEFFLRSQYAESGCWPQMYPINPNHYSRYVTFNDRAMANVIDALLKLDEITDDPRYLEAARRGGECLIALQGGPGEETWGQQHDPETLLPASARAFEPAGYTAGETGSIIEALIELYLLTGEERFLEPIGKVFAWYESSRLDNGNWARIYEIGTGRPLHGDNDGNIHYLLDENSPAPRPGYSWQGDYYPYEAKEAYDRIREIGRTEYLAEREKIEKSVDYDEMAQQVNELLEAQHPDGWWIDTVESVGQFAPGAERRAMISAGAPAETWELIRTDTFVRNANLLMDYIENGR